MAERKTIRAARSSVNAHYSNRAKVPANPANLDQDKLKERSGQDPVATWVKGK